MRTRIKICGLTREADVVTACSAGADAVGFVCYPNSPRHVDPHRLRALARELGPFTVPVLLFVNAAMDAVDAARAAVPTAVLQFHGDEQEPDCARYGAPYVRAALLQQLRIAAGENSNCEESRIAAAIDCHGRDRDAAGHLDDG